MTNSMTAFARSQILLEQGTLIWELRSVNHRYLDAQFKLPETLRDFEPLLREKLKKSIIRGKVECSLKLDRSYATESDLNLNESLARQLIKTTDHLATLSNSLGKINPIDILNWPGILDAKIQADNNLRDSLLSQFDLTLEDFCQCRKREGEELAKLILQRLDAIKIEVSKFRVWLPDILIAQRSKILTRIESLNLEPDMDRLEQELIYLTQKTDVNEELDRIETHITEVKRTLEKDKSAGRRLDFLMQELNREANTLASKSINSQCTQSAIELKVLIEQMREQIQNIE